MRRRRPGYLTETRSVVLSVRERGARCRGATAASSRIFAIAERAGKRPGEGRDLFLPPPAKRITRVILPHARYRDELAWFDPDPSFLQLARSPAKDGGCDYTGVPFCVDLRSESPPVGAPSPESAPAVSEESSAGDAPTSDDVARSRRCASVLARLNRLTDEERAGIEALLPVPLAAMARERREVLRKKWNWKRTAGRRCGGPERSRK